MNIKNNIITSLNIKINRRKKLSFINFFKELFWISKIDLLSIDFSSWEKPKLPRMRKKFIFEFGCINDVLRINSYPFLESKIEAEHNLKLFESGNKIIIGKYNSKIVFYAWVVFKRKSMHNKFFMLKNNECIFMRAFVEKKYRGYGLYTFGLLYAISELKKQGFKTGFADIESHNIISIRSTLKLGFNFSKSGYYLINLLGKKFTIPYGELSSRFVRKKIEKERI